MIQFKSLTIRIWFIISVIVFTIVFIICLAFTFIIKNHNENKAREGLQLAHQLVLQSVSENQFTQTMPHVDNHGAIPHDNHGDILHLDNHGEMHHFIFNKSNGEIQLIDQNDKKPEKSLFLTMSRLLNNQKENVNQKILKENINNQWYLIEISHVKNQSFLFSYQSLMDNSEVLQIIIIGALIILFTLPLSKIIANNIAKPLNQLEAYTKRIANKEWNSDIDLNRNDEIGRLASAMSEMKEALQIADEEEKKFLQSISHDLRTPVMVIMSYAQAIIDGMYAGSPEDSAIIIKNEAIRLEKKIKQILYLNTLDYVLDNDKEKEDVYLAKLLTYLVNNFQAINPHLSWTLNLNKQPAIVLGNADRIRVSIENILENQLRFASKKIQVALKDDSASWMIEISNDGPLISETDLNQIFNSLYKGEKGNFGLGLSISQKIIHYYHGSIKVENRNGLVYFTICYPKKRNGQID